MGEAQGNDKEETGSGADKFDMSWMNTFWEAFSDCVVEMDTHYCVTGIFKKTDSTFRMDDIIGRSFLYIATEKDRAFVASELELLKNASAVYRRFTFQSGQGNYYRWTLVASRIDGRFSGIHGIAVDVTEQSLDEITMNWQRAIIEGGSDFVSISNMGGNVLYTNPGGYKMAGYDPASGALSPERIFTSEHLDTLRGVGMEMVTTSGFWSGLGELICADGKLIPIEHTMFSVRNDYDGTFLIATIIRDITDYIEHERAMEKARTAAEAANIAKSEFLSRMSHEIRTPMNAILGMINIGLSTNDIEKKDYCFERANSASKHLLGLINDILDMSKIEADKFELSYSIFDFEQALKNISNMANVRAEEKRQTFIVNIGDNIPSYISSDELRLTQIITNLLTNAIKFTPEEGTVTLTVDMIEEIDDDITLRIEISDTGIGVSKEQQERLFTSFNQADSSISQRFGGTGLGLSISKRIVELMGGDIWIESKLGQGSKFIFTIIAKKTDRKPRTILSEKISKDKIRILAVDDSEETREYFTHVMEALKLECDVAADGKQAIQMVKDAASPYSIFFVDWQMPGMDGVELTRRIKETSGDNSIIIMISAHDWNTIEREAFEAGVDRFVPKPLFPSTLINAINNSMGVGKEEPAESERDKASKRRCDFSGYTLLVAEDVDINKEIISAVLEETGVSIDYAETGSMAVSMFDTDPERYDLILMDINMPEMDGYEATRLIRSLDFAKAKEVPIIAMTANVFKEDIEKCLSAGMNDHTGKPIDSDALFEQLSKYLTDHREKGAVIDMAGLEESIAWDDNLLTGNALIDMQHKEIFARIGDFIRGCENGDDEENPEDILAFIANYTTRHFVDEEALQVEYGYPGYAQHKNEHEEFIATVDELAERFQANGLSYELSKDINKIVAKWLINHIKNEDKMMIEYIRSVDMEV